MKTTVINSFPGPVNQKVMEPLRDLAKVARRMVRVFNRWQAELYPRLRTWLNKTVLRTDGRLLRPAREALTFETLDFERETEQVGSLRVNWRGTPILLTPPAPWIVSEVVAEVRWESRHVWLRLSYWAGRINQRVLVEVEAPKFVPTESLTAEALWQELQVLNRCSSSSGLHWCKGFVTPLTWGRYHDFAAGFGHHRASCRVSGPGD